MNIFDYYVYLPFVRFHLWTALILILQFLVVFYVKRRYGVWGLVFSMLSVTFSIHFYEVIHGLTEYYTMGYVGASLWFINMPILLLTTMLICYWNFSHSLVSGNLRRSFIILTGFLLNMIWLVSTGFFPDFDFNLSWGLSKVMATLFTLSLFWRNDNAV